MMIDDDKNGITIMMMKIIAFFLVHLIMSLLLPHDDEKYNNVD